MDCLHSGFGEEKVMADRNATFRATQALDKGLGLLVRDGNAEGALGTGTDGGTFAGKKGLDRANDFKTERREA